MLSAIASHERETMNQEGEAMPDPNPRNLRTIREISRPAINFSVARVPNSSRLIVAASDNKVQDLDASQASPTPRELVDHGRYATCVRLAGNTVISGGYDNRLIWYDLAAGRTIRTTADAHAKQLRQLAVSPDGTKLASVADDMVCRLWNISNGQRIQELRGHEARTPTHFGSMLYCCAFSNDGTKLATADRVGHIVVWDVTAGRQLLTLEAPSLYTWDGVQRNRSIGGVRSLVFSPDGTQLAAGGVGQIGNVDGLSGPSRVEIFDLARREKILDFQGSQQGLFNKLVWHPQNSWLCGVGGGANGFIAFYDVGRRQMIHQANLPMHTHDAAFDEDFTTLYAVGHQKIVVQELRG
jgi:WD40 repeat protein